MHCFTSDDKAKESKVEVVHDFGRGYGTDEFESAVLRGKTEVVDGKEIERPLVWGEERLRITLPDPGLAEDRRDFSQHIATSNGLKLVAVAYGDKVSVFELPEWNRKRVLQHEWGVEYVSFSPDDKSLFVTYQRNYGLPEDKKRVRIWDLDAEFGHATKEVDESLQRADMQRVHDQMIKAAKDALLKYEHDWNDEEWHRDAQGILEGGVKELLSKVKRRHLAGVGEYKEIKGLDLASSFGAVPWNSDGTQMLLYRDWKRERIPRRTNGIPADLVVWDIRSHKEASKLEHPGHEGPIMWSGFSNDDQWIASSSWDKKVRVWDAKTGTLKHILIDGASNQSWTGRFSPDSKYLAVGNGDGYLRIWKLETGQLEHKLSIQKPIKDGRDPPGGWVRGIEFTSDSKSILYSNSGGCASLFSLEENLTTQLYIVKAGHMGMPPDEMQEVQLSPDNNRLAFHLQNGHMTVYDIKKNESWQIEQTLESQRKSRISAFGVLRFLDHEGRNVVSFDVGGLLRVWRL